MVHCHSHHPSNYWKVELLLSRPAGRLFFSDVSYFVIDEADAMFDDTFKSETIKLLETISVSFNLDASM